MDRLRGWEDQRPQEDSPDFHLVDFPEVHRQDLAVVEDPQEEDHVSSFKDCLPDQNANYELVAGFAPPPGFPGGPRKPCSVSPLLM